MVMDGTARKSPFNPAAKAGEAKRVSGRSGRGFGDREDSGRSP